MTSEEFERHKEALSAQKLEKPKRLSSQYSHYMNEIALQQYHFDRSEKEVEILATITKDQVLEYYKVRIDISCIRYSLITFKPLNSFSLHLTLHRDSHYRFTSFLTQRTLRSPTLWKKKRQNQLNSCSTSQTLPVSSQRSSCIQWLKATLMSFPREREASCKRNRPINELNTET